MDDYDSSSSSSDDIDIVRFHNARKKRQANKVRSEGRKRPRILYSGLPIRRVDYNTLFIGTCIISIFMVYIALFYYFVQSRYRDMVIIGWSTNSLIAARALKLMGHTVVVFAPRSKSVYYLDNDGQELALEGVPLQHGHKIDGEGIISPLSEDELTRLAKHIQQPVTKMTRVQEELIGKFPYCDEEEVNSAQWYHLVNQVSSNGYIDSKDRGRILAMYDILDTNDLEVIYKQPDISLVGDDRPHHKMLMIASRGSCYFTRKICVDFADPPEVDDIIVANKILGTRTSGEPCNNYLVGKFNVGNNKMTDLSLVNCDRFITLTYLQKLYTMDADLQLMKIESSDEEIAYFRQLTNYDELTGMWAEIIDNNYFLQQPRSFTREGCYVMHPYHLPATHDNTLAIMVSAASLM